jgi:hypothetical protein
MGDRVVQEVPDAVLTHGARRGSIPAGRRPEDLCEPTPMVGVRSPRCQV